MSSLRKISLLSLLLLSSGQLCAADKNGLIFDSSARSSAPQAQSAASKPLKQLISDSHQDYETREKFKKRYWMPAALLSTAGVGAFAYGLSYPSRDKCGTAFVIGGSTSLLAGLIFFLRSGNDQIQRTQQKKNKIMSSLLASLNTEPGTLNDEVKAFIKTNGVGVQSRLFKDLAADNKLLHLCLPSSSTQILTSIKDSIKNQE